MTAQNPDQTKPSFNVILRPNASLGPWGFVWLMAFVSMVSFCVGAIFMMHGAWPVFGFFGLDVLLLYAAFRLNYRAARRYETVRLLPDCLEVTQVSPRGQHARYTFDPYWVRVELAPAKHDPETPGALSLSSHGNSLNIGSFLAPEERVDLADALKFALAKSRAAPILGA